ncbi:MAG: hypothetical protein RLZZ156_24 [Deinococcota bacterium]|jgi:hypothetical protein
MSNLISYDAQNLEPLQMNNGLTSVFVSVLALSASNLAQTDNQRLWAAWIASRDQGIFGGGIVGFDLTQMPWKVASLEADKDFWSRAVAAAKQKIGWECLDYQPHEEWVFSSLDQFIGLIIAFEAADINSDESREWTYDSRPRTLELCKKHLVYLHAYGCVICND